jgi:hypothetical protein
MRTGYGTGLIASALLALVLLLFGLFVPLEALAAGVAFIGLWTVWYGVFLDRNFRRASALYYPGWGLLLIALSTFYFLPARYALGLVFLCLLGIVLVYALRGKKAIR